MTTAAAVRAVSRDSRTAVHFGLILLHCFTASVSLTVSTVEHSGESPTACKNYSLLKARRTVRLSPAAARAMTGMDPAIAKKVIAATGPGRGPGDRPSTASGCCWHSPTGPSPSPTPPTAHCLAQRPAEEDHDRLTAHKKLRAGIKHVLARMKD